MRPAQVTGHSAKPVCWRSLRYSRDGQGDELERWLRKLPPTLGLADVLGRVERLLICRAMEQSGGVQAEAARRLGLSRSDLHYKLRKQTEGGVKKE